VGYSGGTANGQVKDNFFHTSVQFSSANSGLVMTGNTFAGGTINLSQSSYPNNSYLASKPTSNVISVRPNQYEAGRANIVIFNYQKLSTVSVNVSGIGLNTGDVYELRNAADFYSDVITGTYNGSSINIPMTGHTVARPVGQNFALPPSTFPDFGAFVIMKKGGSVAPPTTTTNTPPTISSIAGQNVNQNTATAPIGFTVSDKETPASSLTLSAASSNTTLVPTANIVFGGSGSNRTVTVTPAASQSGSASITVRVSDGTNTTSTSFTLTVNQMNGAPAISAVGAQTIVEDTSTSALAFTVSDNETAAASLVVTANSSNPALIPNTSIVLGGSGNNRTVRVTPAPNQDGSAMITLMVNDGTASASTSFPVLVTAVNDLPTISSIGNQTLAAGTASAPISFTVGDVETTAANLVIQTSSSSQTLIPNASLVLGGSGANRTLTITPASGQSGSATITVSVNDGVANSSTTFTVTVSGSTPPASTNMVYLGLEAEEGVLAAPMVVVTNTQNKALRYIWSTSKNQGTARYTINIPQAGIYYIWCKVLAPNYSSDSFFVSVDGQEDVFDAAENSQSSNWRWSRVNGRGAKGVLALDPRTFNLSQGTHTIVIRGRETKAGVDRLIITNDKNYVPKDVVPVADTVTAYSGTSTQILPADLLGNDVSLFEEPLKVTAVGGATNGTVSLINNAITYASKSGFVGTDAFSYTVADQEGSTSIGKVTVQVKTADSIYLGLEAEDGTAVSPMTIITDPQIVTRRYVASSVASQGTITYAVDIPKTDTYVLWFKVLCPSYASDSFFVSVDGQEDVFDAAEGKTSSSWQWSQVNGRNGTSTPMALNPRSFTLSQGKHTIVIRGREASAAVDHIVISNDRNYVPQDVVAVADTVTATTGVLTQIASADLLRNDIALFGNTLTLTAVGTAQNGTLALSNGTISYTSKAGFTGTDTFTYTVTDGQGATNTATVTVTVQAATAIQPAG
jgi:hypothetical protein